MKADRIGTERVQIGRFSSRALWTPAKRPAPAILLIPGSGPQGPEEMMPAKLTVNNRDVSLFAQVSQPFIDAGFNVLALGKPGVEFFQGWEPTGRFYDVDMLKNLKSEGLVDNASDAIEFLRHQGSVRSEAIYVLGHSEGTQVATDLAARTELAGLILLGYSGEDMITTVKWQVFEREIEYFLRSDLDANHDGFVSQVEAAAWPEFSWSWQPGQDRVANAEIESAVKNNPQKQAIVEQMRHLTMCQAGACERGPYYERTVRFGGPIFAFTGELDLQTRAAEARKLKETCVRLGKKNCVIEIIPGVQHGFSSPRPPRRHPIFDATVGPVEEGFLKRLGDLARSLAGNH